MQAPDEVELWAMKPETCSFRVPRSLVRYDACRDGGPTQPQWVAPGESISNLKFITYGQSYSPYGTLALVTEELDRPWKAIALDPREEEEEQGEDMM
jgi:hypothetical protein